MRHTGFDFTTHVAAVAADMTVRVPRLRHIDMTRVAVSFRQTRVASAHGMYACMTPLRFADGATVSLRRGRNWGLPRVYDGAGREMFYILSFYLPRFLDLKFRDKLETIAHELWHIGPKFDGDLRRHAGRCFAHGHSQKAYDALVVELVDEWLAAGPPAELYDFLRLSFQELAARHGRVFGKKYPLPRLRPLE